MPYQILLVDDDREFREELRDCLDEYDVIGVGNGTEALQLLKRPNEVDLVILDVMMPGPRGTEVLKEIKRRSPELKTIILTGFSSKSVAIDALKGRADEYLEKPLDIARLKSAVVGLLAGSGEGEDLGDRSTAAKIRRIKRFLEKNWHKKVCLRDVSRAVGWSEKYLSRLFKEETGTCFNDYALKVKVAEAKKLLAKSWSVGETADRLGYQNAESFIRIFKKLAGRTPAQYKKRHAR